MLLALVDFIPNIAFSLGAIFLTRLIHRECGRVCASLMLLGSTLVLLGGILKAIWKLLYVMHIADISILSEIQFALLAPGFLLMFIGVVWFHRCGVRFTPLAAIMPWKIPLLVTMLVSNLGMLGVLLAVSVQRKIKWATLCFIVSIVCVLAMGGLSAGEQTVAKQWIEESVNSIGLTYFALGCYLLHQTAQAVKE